MRIVACLISVDGVDSPADLEALEVALQLKEADAGSSVLALSLAPPGPGDGILRTALSVGADEAALVWDKSLPDADSLTTARALAAAARQFGPDVVVFGDRSPDSGTGQVPYQFAEVMDLPCLDAALAASVRDNSVVVEQPAGPGVRRRLRCRLPAVLVIAPTGRLLRYPRTAERMRAQKAAIPVISPGDAGGARAPGVRVLRLGLPKPRRRAPLAEAMALPLRERLRYIAEGGMAAKGGIVIPAEPAATAAAEIIAFLRSRQVIRDARPEDGRTS